MEDYSDSDTSLVSEYESDGDTDELSENLEPELSGTIHEKYKKAPWNPKAQLDADIKARAQLPDPTYQKLQRAWPSRPFDVQILADYVQHPIYYFDLFLGT
jgi:hypothetical protein